jgi:ATP synthase F1 delta subunit
MNLIVRHYAKTLGDLAQEHGCIEDIQSSFEQVSEWFHQNPSVYLHLASPSLPFQSARLWICEISDMLRLHDWVRHCLLILKREKRFALFPQIVADIQERFDFPHGVVRCTIDVACPLTGPEKRRIKKLLEQRFQKAIVLTYQIHPDIKGGWILRTPEQKIDYSLRYAVQRMFKQIRLPTLQPHI